VRLRRPRTWAPTLVGRGRRLLASSKRVCIIEEVLWQNINGNFLSTRLEQTAWSCLLGMVCLIFTVSKGAEVKLGRRMSPWSDSCLLDRLRVLLPLKPILYHPSSTALTYPTHSDQQVRHNSQHRPSETTIVPELSSTMAEPPAKRQR
jgi:hypothetical protein